MSETRKNDGPWNLEPIERICSNCGAQATHRLKTFLLLGIFPVKRRCLCDECAVKWMKDELTV